MASRFSGLRAALVFSGFLVASVGASTVAIASPSQENVAPIFADVNASPIASGNPISESVVESVTESVADKDQAAAAIDLIIEPVSDSPETAVSNPTPFSGEAALVVIESESTIAESEAAMRELVETLNVVVTDNEANSEAINATDFDDNLASVVIEDISVARGLVERNAIAGNPVVAVTRPNASALGNLQSASLSTSLSATVVHANLAATTAQVTAQNVTVQAETITALTSALNSDNILTRLYAADALWSLTTNRELILPTLNAAATSDNLHARGLAIAALEQIGDRAGIQTRSATPLLTEVLNSDSRTRQTARDAVDMLRSENRPATVLGIIARESRRMMIPVVIRSLTGLWR